jgi:hypothetical protein
MNLNAVQTRHPDYAGMLTRKWRIYIEDITLLALHDLILRLESLVLDTNRVLLNYIVADIYNQSKIKIILQTLDYQTRNDIERIILPTPHISQTIRFQYAFIEPLPSGIKINTHMKYHPHKLATSPPNTFPWNKCYVPYQIPTRHILQSPCPANNVNSLLHNIHTESNTKEDDTNTTIPT